MTHPFSIENIQHAVEMSALEVITAFEKHLPPLYLCMFPPLFLCPRGCLVSYPEVMFAKLAVGRHSSPKKGSLLFPTCLKIISLLINCLFQGCSCWFAGQCGLGFSGVGAVTVLTHEKTFLK